MSNIIHSFSVLQFEISYDSPSIITLKRLHHFRTYRRGYCDSDSPCSRLFYELHMRLHSLVSSHQLISDQVSPQEVSIIVSQLESELERGVRGAIVEFGCYAGTTSLFIRRLLDAHHLEEPFHVYDSFAGLPEKVAQDQSVAGDQFRIGELLATKKQFLHHFHKANLRPPIVHKAWFNQLNAEDIPDEIMFAFLDGDYYESIRDSLKLITPKFAEGAIIVVDDYANEALPGASRAVDEWRRNHHVTMHIEASLAIIRT